MIAEIATEGIVLKLLTGTTEVIVMLSMLGRINKIILNMLERKRDSEV